MVGMNLEALFKLSYGMYIVCSKKGERLNGQIANTVFQVTAEPVRIAVSISKQNLTHEFIAGSRRFSISVLEQDTPFQYIGLWGFRSGRDIDKFKDVKHRTGESGMPLVLDHAVACIELEVEQAIDLGTHTLFIGRVLSSEVLSDNTIMTYAHYREVKKGKTPDKAPTFVPKASPVHQEVKDG